MVENDMDNEAVRIITCGKNQKNIVISVMNQALWFFLEKSDINLSFYLDFIVNFTFLIIKRTLMHVENILTLRSHLDLHWTK